MFRKLFKTAALGLAFLLTLSVSGSLHAQTLVGQIAGNVVDSTGGALPAAAVKITNVGTQAVRSVNSDNSGFFTVTNLPIGSYTITVSKEGFRGETRTGISVNADSHLTATSSCRSALPPKPLPSPPSPVRRSTPPAAKSPTSSTPGRLRIFPSTVATIPSS